MKTVVVMTPPRLAGSRRLAAELLAEYPNDLTEAVVRVELRDVRTTAPAFVDELVRLALVEREAATLELVGAPQRTGDLAERFATNRVRDRLVLV